MREVRPQPAFLRLADAAFASPLLEIGTGQGDLALYLAGLGHDVLGVDIDAEAIAAARARARLSKRTVRFLVLDVRNLPLLSRRFACVVDSGLLHALDAADRARVAEALSSVVEPGGVFHVLGHTERLGRDGPARWFHDGWHVEAARAERHFPPQNPEGVPAVLATLRRIPRGLAVAGANR